MFNSFFVMLTDKCTEVTVKRVAFRCLLKKRKMQEMTCDIYFQGSYKNARCKNNIYINKHNIKALAVVKENERVEKNILASSLLPNLSVGPCIQLEPVKWEQRTHIV